MASTAQVEVALGDLVACDAELLRLLERLHPLERRLAQHVARRVQQERVGLQVGWSGLGSGLGVGLGLGLGLG